MPSCDYLVVGHVSQDITPHGARPGGSVAYAALTVQGLGLRPCVVTSCAEVPKDLLAAHVKVHCIPSQATTTFSLTEGPQGRILQLQALAASIPPDSIPAAWLRAPIVHFAPIAREIPAEAIRRAAGRFIGVTPQGWLRRWEADGMVHPSVWPQAEKVLGEATAAVLSIEDIDGDEALAAQWAEHVPVLVLTRGAEGATVFWQGNAHAVAAPAIAQVVDTIGAGDIFAAAFFVRLAHTRDPLAAARFAVRLASASVTRPGLAAIPTPEEIATALASSR